MQLPNNASRFPDLPAHMRGLATDKRGFPVPWFVPWIDGQPVFPAMDPEKRNRAARQRLCWVCGGPLRRVSVFVIGPMCIVNRISSEPPSHPACARFSARHCPFLSNPRMGRVGTEYKGHELTRDTAGFMIERNPGVTALWQTLDKRLVRLPDGKGDWLFSIGSLHYLEWFCQGRPATRGEVLRSIEGGLPTLRALAESEPDPGPARAELDRMERAAFALLPA